MAISLASQALSSSALSFNNRTLNSCTRPNPPLFYPTNRALKGWCSAFVSPLPSLRSSGSSKRNYFHIHGSGSFLARCAVHEAASADAAMLTNEEDRALQDDVKDKEDDVEEMKEGSESIPQNESDLKNVFASYREAILSGDQETATAIEAELNASESTKNELVIKVSALSAEITSGRDRYIRLQADFDNFRKRSENERLNIRSDAQGAVIESLLPMVDSFERAKQQIKPETDKEKKIDTSYQGIYKQFLEIMKSMQVTAVPTVGHPFDPSVHEAIAREESQEYEDGIVLQEFRPGFLVGERLIRPAMVKVSAGPGPGPKTEEAPATVEDHAEQEAAAEG
ncbi:unnamed protein product [Linum trigynum]|uniref:GrpE protein homolog n=1 Tax=Linum trigynum TaxID=586398 RepID=A0AAV2GPG6_9ROSI